VQVLKLGLIQGVPGLSEYFVIWDFDMLPARSIPLFYTDSPPLPNSADRTLRWDRLRTVVNIGGTRARGYGESFAALFGRPCAPLPKPFLCISIFAGGACAHRITLAAMFLCLCIPTSTAFVVRRRGCAGPEQVALVSGCPACKCTLSFAASPTHAPASCRCSKGNTCSACYCRAMSISMLS
jgi:hypothetical protein